MTAERLHFMVESPANFVRLACTILFEKKKLWPNGLPHGMTCSIVPMANSFFFNSWKNFSRTAAPLEKRSLNR